MMLTVYMRSYNEAPLSVDTPVAGKIQTVPLPSAGGTEPPSAAAAVDRGASAQWPWPSNHAAAQVCSERTPAPAPLPSPATVLAPAPSPASGPRPIYRS